MSQPFPAVLGGRWSALEGGYQSNDSNGLRLPSPTAYGNLAAWYDVSDYSSLVVDGSNRVSLIADKSGNSATNCLCLPGSASNHASTPDSAAISITGDIDFRIDAAANDWTPSSAQVFASSYDGTSSGYQLELRTDGTLRFYAGNGTTALTWNSSVAPTVSDFGRIQIRLTLDVDSGGGNSTATFYTRTDGLLASDTGWSQLGTAVTAASLSMANSSQVYRIGRYAGLDVAQFAGRIYRHSIYNGIAGTLVFDANFATASKLATSFTESSSNAATVTINSSGDLGARISGERDLVQLTASKQPVYLPWSGTNYGFTQAVAGAVFSTPSATANQFSSELEFAVVGTYDWALGGTNVLVAKSGGAGNRGVALQQNAAFLNLQLSTDGATLNNYVATATHTLTSGQYGGLKATWRASDGRIQFFQTTDGTSWTKIGNDVTGPTSNLFATTERVTIAGNATGSAAKPTGNVWRAWLGKTIGVESQVFDPTRYVSGTTFTGGGGETWTLEGAATIVNRTSVYFDGSDDYIQSAAFSQSQPLTNYFVGSQVSWTNLDAIYDGRADASMQLLQNVGTPTVSLSSGTPVASNSGFAIGARGLASAVFNGASSSLRINRGTATTGNPGSVAPNGLTVGARMAAGAVAGWANCTLNEQAIYAAAHDVATRDRWALYSGSKWSISV